MTTPAPESKSSNGSGGAPPPTIAILIVYSILGVILSYKFGRDPSSTNETSRNADDVAKELAPTISILCLFLVSYSLVDVMTVGSTKHKYGIGGKPYSPSMASNVPEEVYIAQRVQMNQVEQLPAFIVASLGFSFFVNGRVGSILALVWVVLRRLYARAYRLSIGKPLSQSGITLYTIPAYFVMNALLMGTAVQCIRSL